jgi:hypothetical protein
MPFMHATWPVILIFFIWALQQFLVGTNYKDRNVRGHDTVQKIIYLIINEIPSLSRVTHADLFCLKRHWLFSDVLS